MRNELTLTSHYILSYIYNTFIVRHKATFLCLVVDFFILCLNKPYGKLFSKNTLKGSAALWFCQNRGKFEIRHSRCRPRSWPPFLAEVDAISLRSYRKTRSNLHICFGHIINHLSTFLKLDIVSKKLVT